MRILIDTHVLIWCDQRPTAIAPRLMTALRDMTTEVFVSAASVWEIAIKRATGKLQFAAPIMATVGALGFDLLPILAEHAERAGGLPRHHNDPFDRLIVAQAELEGMMLGSQDRLLRPYGVTIVGLRERGP